MTPNTYQDAVEANEAFEREEFEKRKRMGLKWRPVREESMALYLSAIENADRAEIRLERLVCLNIAVTVGLVVLLIARGLV